MTSLIREIASKKSLAHIMNDTIRIQSEQQRMCNIIATRKRDLPVYTQLTL